MKKTILFLIILIALTFYAKIDVKAQIATFYEAEYIQGIWMNKSPRRGNNTIYYQKARFFRQVGTNSFAYCIEPFKFFESGSNYQSTINPNNLSASQKERISLIAHFGYGYPNHTSEKWYAITQFMIWQAADPEGDYYFTDSLNGKRITRFTEEMTEINNLIANYQTTPSMSSTTHKMVEGTNLTIQDSNNVLSYYTTTHNNAKIENNSLLITDLKEGRHTITLNRQETVHNKPIIFYQSTTSQNLVETGDLPQKSVELNLEVQKTSLTVTKIDSDTKTTTPSGQATLSGAIYELYDANMNKIKSLKIEEDCKSTIESLPYGKYYLQEISAGVGYEVDKNTYSFEITEELNNINLVLENKVIKKKITINKLYGQQDNFQKEANIMFNIYDKNNQLIDTITTNELGTTEIYLPYGIYTIKQLNTTPGYSKVEPINIEIKDNLNITYNLTDYKIKVPNTKKYNNNILIIIIVELIQKILC